MKRYLLSTLVGMAAASACNSQPSPQPNERHWTKGETHCFSTATADERRLELSTASRNGDQLFGDFMLTNMSDKTPVPATVIIRGTQLADGTFWPRATLEVSDNPKGPWKAVGESSKSGPELTLTVPASIMAAGLKVDFAAFEPFLATGGWGKVTFPTGESAIIDLKFLRDSD